MTYDTQRIQPKGREGYVGQEKGVWEAKYGKGKRGPKNKERPIVACKCCGKQFIIPPGASLKTVNCSKKCGSNTRPKDIIANEKRKCMTCHALIGMTGAASGRMLKMSKGQIAVFRKTNDLPRFDRSIAATIGGCKIKERTAKSLPWWGDAVAEKGWMSEIRVKDFDWSSILTDERNKRRGREYQAMMHRTSTKQSPYRIKKICRSRIYNAIKRIGKTDKPRIKYRTEHMIGCKMEHLVKHLESRFSKGMNWDNHGSEWHIDHIIPCSSFDFTNESHILQCSHYSNLQPLWARDNYAKSDNITSSTQMAMRL